MLNAKEIRSVEETASGKGSKVAIYNGPIYVVKESYDEVTNLIKGAHLRAS